MDPDRNLRLLNVFWALREFHLWIPIWIVFLTEERGFSLTDVTVAEGCSWWGWCCSKCRRARWRTAGGVRSRWRWGRRRWRSPSSCSPTTNFGILLASFLFWSVASTLMSGADMALLFDTLKVGGREGEYERRAGRGHALAWAGAGVATLAGGPVAAATSLRVVIFTGTVTCAALVVVALLLREVPRSAPAPAPEAAGARDGYWRSIGVAFREVWHAPDVRAVILLAGCATAAAHAVGYLVQPYLLDRGIEVGVLFSLLQVPTIAAGVVGALLAARLGGGRTTTMAMLAVPIAAAGAYGVLGTAPGLAGFPAILVLYLAATLLIPVASGYVNRRTSSERRATVLSMQGMVTSLTMAALAPGFGFATDQWGLPWAFALGAGVSLATVAVLGKPVVRSR
ncbi:MAG: hypothetical protein IPG47_14665 [Thermoflexaceae bacterium]|nr:hypothetical protein [Thermoflexaceae bacterium]